MWTISDERDLEKRIEDLEFDDLISYALKMKDNWVKDRLVYRVSTAIGESLEQFSLDKLFGIVILLNEKVNDKIPYGGKELEKEVCQIILDTIGIGISQEIKESIKYDKEG